MIVFKLNIEEFEYAYRVSGPYEPDKGLIFDRSKYLLDPYARAVTGQSRWGDTTPRGQHYKARVVKDDFDWGTSKQPLLPMEDLIIYELHVRGYTQHPSSGVKNPGTFAGLKEKIPYLKELGINQLELMPIYEFSELASMEGPELRKYAPLDGGETRINYWGYSPKAYYFAPKASYAATDNPVWELKELIRELHKNGIELVLEFYFPKGTKASLVLSCIRYWVVEYHIDGVHINRGQCALWRLWLRTRS